MLWNFADGSISMHPKTMIQWNSAELRQNFFSHWPLWCALIEFGVALTGYSVLPISARFENSDFSLTRIYVFVMEGVSIICVLISNHRVSVYLLCSVHWSLLNNQSNCSQFNQIKAFPNMKKTKQRNATRHIHILLNGLMSGKTNWIKSMALQRAKCLTISLDASTHKSNKKVLSKSHSLLSFIRCRSLSSRVVCFRFWIAFVSI